MTKLSYVRLKKSRDKTVRSRHHWIFSGAIDKAPRFQDGDILPVHSNEGELLGQASFRNKASLAGRMLAFGDTTAEDAIKLAIKDAVALRKVLFTEDTNTNAYRLINGEGDRLPGLVVDSYNNNLVVQINSCGMEKLRELIVEELKTQLNPTSIYEKSIGIARQKEGLSDVQHVLDGDLPGLVTVKELGHQFLIDPVRGQKTGFFLDQREMRRCVQGLARGRRVLNCFSYTGGFSVAAMAGGASFCHSVDSSSPAIDLCKENLALNGFSEGTSLECSDVFDFLSGEEWDYDFVILDPPAFAKSKKDIVSASRAYRELNRLALERMPSQSLLLTCSCSYHVDEVLFQKLLFQAALKAKRQLKIVSRHQLAGDHPINLYHPEGQYLKSFLCYVE